MISFIHVRGEKRKESIICHDMKPSLAKRRLSGNFLKGSGVFIKTLFSIFPVVIIRMKLQNVLIIVPLAKCLKNTFIKGWLVQTGICQQDLSKLQNEILSRKILLLVKDSSQLAVSLPVPLKVNSYQFYKFYKFYTASELNFHFSSR